MLHVGFSFIRCLDLCNAVCDCGDTIFPGPLQVHHSIRRPFSVPYFMAIISALLFPSFLQLSSASNPILNLKKGAQQLEVLVGLKSPSVM